jgi:hypothetical protein
VLLEPEVPVDVVHRKKVDIQTSCWVQQVERWQVLAVEVEEVLQDS